MGELDKASQKNPCFCSSPRWLYPLAVGHHSSEAKIMFIFTLLILVFENATQADLTLCCIEK